MAPKNQTDSSSRKKLKSGYTTGACAAAAAKAAVVFLYQGRKPGQVEIPFPGGVRHRFTVNSCSRDQAGGCRASIIKNAGDDPDVTNGAEISALAEKVSVSDASKQIILEAGAGVGTVTKPGLPIPVGEPAINPVPRRMIREAVREAMPDHEAPDTFLRITISIRDGEKLAANTLNKRLGILGGLSVLGTTGIVRPVSARAWTDTIEASMRVARAAGLDEVLLSTGRTSEAAVAELLHLPEESQVMMGDYLDYSLKAAAGKGFKKIHLAGMWAKILKCALCIPQTHVRNGALETEQAAWLLQELGLAPATAAEMAAANTAREIFIRLRSAGQDHLIQAVCEKAREYAVRQSGLKVHVYLVTTEEGVVHRV